MLATKVHRRLLPNEGATCSCSPQIRRGAATAALPGAGEACCNLPCKEGETSRQSEVSAVVLDMGFEMSANIDAVQMTAESFLSIEVGRIRTKWSLFRKAVQNVVD